MSTTFGALASVGSNSIGGLFLAGGSAGVAAEASAEKAMSRKRNRMGEDRSGCRNVRVFVVTRFSGSRHTVATFSLDRTWRRSASRPAEAGHYKRKPNRYLFVVTRFSGSRHTVATFSRDRTWRRSASRTAEAGHYKRKQIVSGGLLLNLMCGRLTATPLPVVNDDQRNHERRG